jgi:Trk K+ transport system NAD-binding subunit
VVAMFTDDERNYRVSEIALEKFGIPRRIVRINDPSWTKRFQQLGVQVVDPTSAMVNVLDASVRSPQSAELLISQDSEYDTVQVTITDRDVVGLAVRDLYLPDDVLILGIRRRKQWIMPHGYTMLRHNDEVTFLGKPDSLTEVQRRFGY